MQDALLRHSVIATVAVTIAVIFVAAGSSPAAAQGVGPDYVVQAGDVLQIFIYDQPDLSRSYQVGPSGYINIPIVGPVLVSDHTLSGLQRVLRKQLLEVIRDPYVTVGIDEAASSRKVTVTGFVSSAGSAALSMEATVRDAVINAGITDRSDLTAVELHRDGSLYQTVDLSGLRTVRPLEEPVPLRWDDVIYVPRITDRIAVLGEVNTPSALSIPPGEMLTVLEAIKQVGDGFTETADPNSAKLLRRGASSPIVVDLDALLNSGDMSQNYELFGGDVLLVQEGDPVTVFGAVNSPVAFHIEEPIDVLEAVIRAGGFSERSDVAHAELIRNGQPTALDLEALWKEGDLAQNVDVRPGDYLSVPEKEPEEILVMGAIDRQGPIEITEMESRSLSKIVLMTQPTEDADLSRVQVYRDDETVVRDLVALREEGALAEDLQIQPGDVVVIPELGRVYLVGALSKPGVYPWHEDWTLFDYLSRAGLGGEVEAREGALIRPGEEGEADVHRIDLGRFMDGDVPQMTVEPGDIIFFKPPKRDRPLLEYLREYLWLLDITLRLFD